MSWKQERSAKMHIGTSIQAISGIGKARAEKLAKMGVHTVGDLIRLYPRAYENRGATAMLGDYILDTPRSYILTVSSAVTSARVKNRMTISKFRAFDDSGSVEIVFFNSPYIKDIFHVGTVFRFFGKPSFTKTKRLTLVSPKFEPVIDGSPLPSFVPVYPLTDGITSKLITKAIETVIDSCTSEMADYLPEEIRLGNNLPSLQYAMRNIHFPTDEEALRRAQRRLAFDEMLFFALNISIAGAKRERMSGVSFKPVKIEPFTDLLPYELTQSQKDAINDIYRDTVIRREGGRTPAMARIIIGDVGCGKTVCSAAAIYFAAKSGYQSALMVPTEILARQHYEDIGILLGKLGIRSSLLLGSTTAKEKREIYQMIEDGTVDLVIGTHALLSDKFSFARLGLIITDEQHRFGVAQRAALKDKTHDAHVLVMSATPIPRSLALALYGDLDISRITDMPKGRQRADTYVVGEEYRTRLNDFIKKQVALGGQCYIICPSIEGDDAESSGSALVPHGIEHTGLVEGEALKLKNTVAYTEELKCALPSLKVECLHGRMKNQEKDEIMKAFAAGEIDVLVSTTVIEVGVNVPNASLMIVENAERFGLAQLHQLRGRVGRGTRKSYCVLVSDVNSEKSKARLEALRTTYDGFDIASRDLALRGPGDFFSANSDLNFRQSGGFEFKLAKLCDDSNLFDLAFAAAKSIVAKDPELTRDEHKALREYLVDMTSSPATIS